MSNRDPNQLKCLICGKKFNHLGSHIWNKHKILARDYKMEFGLPINMALISEEIYKKKSEYFEENREKFVKQLLKGGAKYKFKKGHKQTKNSYRSPYAKKKEIERIKKFNNTKMELCPVCNIQYQNLDKHLLATHKLIRIKENE